MDNILLHFGSNVKKARLEKGLSQEKLAELSSLHRTYIGMIERGERSISLRNIQVIANALDVSVSFLFEE